MKKLLTYILALAFLAGCASEKGTKKTVQRPTAEDNEYDKESTIMARSQFLDNEATLRIFLELDIERLYGEATPVSKLASQFTISYIVITDYGSKDILVRGNVPLLAENIGQRGKQMVIPFDLKKPANVAAGLMLLEIYDLSTGQKVIHDIPLRFDVKKLSDRFSLFGKDGKTPLIRQYAFLGDTVQIRSLNSSEKTLTVYRYNHQFEPALSPMAVAVRNAKKNLDIDSTFQVRTNTPFVLDQAKLYFFVEDTTAANGLSLVGVDRRYPRYTRAEQLTQPLIYMSTKDEIKELENPAEPKKTLDKYWLRLTSGNQQIAKRTIKLYYRRVEAANRWFTTYKEGWKTDMGMVYIIFGPPNKVVRTKDKEVWTYTQSANFSEINFNFIKRPNQFLENHYELVRYSEYEPIWYPTVEEWRTGVAGR